MTHVPPGEPTPGTKANADPTVKISGSAGTWSKATLPPRQGEIDPSQQFGKFVRTKKLGAGGMGEVWQAWDTGLGRWVALKFMKGGDEDEIARFKREAQVAGKLTHPNIAAIYEVGEGNGRHYIAMQFVDGQTLKTFPRNDRKLLARLMRDGARAVAYAHEQGIVHRDLKPENLMVATRARSGGGPEEHHLYVMDFGLARPTEGAAELSVSGSVVGTPSYMPPEQARGIRVDPRADVWSLGATLYELITDRVPFKGANVYETLRKVQDEEVKGPRKVDPKIDSDLETIVLKCLEKERDRRYPSAKELAEDLDRWLEGEPITARRSSFVYRLRKKIAKRKAVAGTIGGAFLVVAVVLAVVIPQLIKRQQALAAARAKLGQKDAELSATQQQLLQQMRDTSDACLEAALELRRHASVVTMAKYSDKVRDICDKVSQAIQGIGEPHYRYGRILRAQLRDGEALVRHEEALSKEAGFAPARYERGILLALQHRAAVHASILAATRRKVAARALGEAPPDAPMLPEAGDLRKRIAEELGAVEGAKGLLETERLAAKGWRAWAEGDRAAARKHFEEALAWVDPKAPEPRKPAPPLEEAVDGLVLVWLEEGNREEALRAAEAAAERDKGYAPHLEISGCLRLERGTPEDAKAAVARFGLAIGQHPERVSSLTGWAMAMVAAGEAGGWAKGLAERLAADKAEAWAWRLRGETLLEGARQKQARREKPDDDARAAREAFTRAASLDASIDVTEALRACGELTRD